MEPNTRSSTRTARGTPMQLQGPKKPLHAWLHIRTGQNKSEPMRLLREASANLKGTTTWSIPQRCDAPQNMWEAWGCAQTTRGVRKLLNKKLNLSREVIRDRESTYKKCVLTCDFSYELRILRDFITKYCCESRNDCVVLETTMSVISESVLTRARKLTGIE